MQIEQIYTGCLSQGAYYIESEGEAVVIDPLRDTDQYISMAANHHAQIKYVFETHFHADFVSGHIDLAKATGATIVYGPTAKPSFQARIAGDGDRFRVGKLEFELLHTPGHTMESSCFLLFDENGKPTALFSGDTLFIGDVGRPDLAQKAANLSLETLAGLLFDSLRNKIMPLADDIMVYPAHGAGSACGKKLSTDKNDTLGHQKQSNYALRASMSKDEFIREVTTGLVPPPGYFPYNVQMNKDGYEQMEEVVIRCTTAYSPAAFEAAAEEAGAIILDTRHARDFGNGFIPGSINIGIDGSFAVWVGALISNVMQPILLVTDEGREKEVVTRLSRVGFDHAMGFLKGGIDAWQLDGKDLDQITSVGENEIASLDLNDPNTVLLDVRKKTEYDAEHIIGAINLPLDIINLHPYPAIDLGKTYYVHCGGGYRSMIFVSILRSRGYRNLLNCTAGFHKLKVTGRFQISEYHQQESQL